MEHIHFFYPIILLQAGAFVNRRICFFAVRFSGPAAFPVYAASGQNMQGPCAAAGFAKLNFWAHKTATYIFNTWMGMKNIDTGQYWWFNYIDLIV